ncbi:glycosyltransferase family 4 protein [Staphylococcus sp. GDY8P47P]|uniref:glycosyltransferase family 4 protein n=2 Tax=unclassified Staphylococcus TaxID=91994 RepID=UPI00194EE3E1|nr:glycosyltransferase family 4 protein [Staphylococcus sp. GDY8P47P]
MKVLHLNSNFLFTKIYENQIKSMPSYFEHIIYNPLKNEVENNSDITVLKPKNLSKLDSILSFKRLSKSYKYLKNKVSFNQIGIIHAHTMTNDGLLALKISKKYNIPYILTIRNTDINFTLKYKKHLKRTFYKVIMNSQQVIFPNHSYQEKLLATFKGNSKLKMKLRSAIIIPNGVDGLWLNNPAKYPKSINKDHIKILFIGRIYSNKNLHNLLAALDDYKNCELTIIGKVIDQKYFNNLKKEYNLNYLGEKSKFEIIEIMKEHQIFAMPSFNETFGLVYIEALSQNLPILYTKSEGIYNYFEEKRFGIGVEPNNITSIKEGLDFIIDNYQILQNNLKDKTFLNDFNWDNIGKSYEKLYLGEYDE